MEFSSVHKINGLMLKDWLDFPDLREKYSTEAEDEEEFTVEEEIVQGAEPDFLVASPWSAQLNHLMTQSFLSCPSAGTATVLGDRHQVFVAFLVRAVWKRERWLRKSEQWLNSNKSGRSRRRRWRSLNCECLRAFDVLCHRTSFFFFLNDRCRDCWSCCPL